MHICLLLICLIPYLGYDAVPPVVFVAITLTSAYHFPDEADIVESECPWSEDVLPNKLRVTALSNDGLIMAIEHSVLPLYGVQFHPESVMTEYGKKIIENFIKYEHINAS